LLELFQTLICSSAGVIDCADDLGEVVGIRRIRLGDVAAKRVAVGSVVDENGDVGGELAVGIGCIGGNGGGQREEQEDSSGEKNNASPVVKRRISSAVGR
jgi:hypothetical protein